MRRSKASMHFFSDTEPDRGVVVEDCRPRRSVDQNRRVVRGDSESVSRTTWASLGAVMKRRGEGQSPTSEQVEPGAVT